jgi:mono/diheme cytochrome c family protein
LSDLRLRRTYDIVLLTTAVSPEPHLVERGRYLAVTRGCTDCHTADLGGQVIMNEPGVALISATNLTRGEGGIGSRYDDADWERAIRHGVGPDGRALAIMPSREYFGLSEADVTALIAYLKTVPQVDRNLPARKLGPLGRTLLVARLLPAFAAESIDHRADRPAAPPEGETVEYGRYIAMICAGCHADDFAGGKDSGPPGSPPASNLTPHATGIGDWSESDFFRAMREGERPDGSEIQREFMPWPAFAQMTDLEIRALWLYLQSLPAVEAR